MTNVRSPVVTALGTSAVARSILRESYKEHYLLEGARRNELAGALTVPIAILSAVLGALAVVCKELHPPLGSAAILQISFVLAAAAACAFCAYSLFRSLYGLAYAFVPTPTELRKFKEDLVRYYVASGRSETEAETVADSESVDYLYSEYATNADRNATNNDIKSAFIHNANGALILSVVLTACAGIIFLFLSITTPTASTKVEITNMPTANTLLKEGVQAATAPTAPPPAPPSPLVRPVPPPSKIIREHTPPAPPPVPERR